MKTWPVQNYFSFLFSAISLVFDFPYPGNHQQTVFHFVSFVTFVVPFFSVVPW